MSAKDCINGKAETGEVTPEQAAEASDLFDETFAEAGESTRAGLLAAQQLEFRKARNKKLAFIQLQKEIEVHNRLDVGSGNELDNALAILGRAPSFRPGVRRGVNLEDAADTVRAEIMGQFAGALDQAAAGIGGFRASKLGRAGERDFLRAVLEDAPVANDDAKALANGWRAATAHIRRVLHESGVPISELDNYMPTPREDTLRMARMSAEEYADMTLPLLDPTKMIDFGTGRPLRDDRLRELLLDVYRTKISDGLNKRTALGAGRRGGARFSMIDRVAEAKFLHFRDAESWLAYNQAVGGSTVGSAMLSHIDQVSHMIAQMRVLGPDADATVAMMRTVVGQASVERQATARGRRATAAQAVFRDPQKQVQDLYDVVSGRIHTGGNAFWATWLQSARNLVTSNVLGSAVISAVSDIAFNIPARIISGVPVSRAMRSTMRQAVKTADGRQALIDAGYISMHYTHNARTAFRDMNDFLGRGITERLAQITVRTQGLQLWTDLNRGAFYMDVATTYARSADQAFDDLDPRLRGGLERQGIDAKEWDLIRRSERFNDEVFGTTLLRPQDVQDAVSKRLGNSDRGSEIAGKYHQALLWGTKLAVPEPTARTRSLLTFGTRPGTLLGETARTLTQFMSFTTSVMNTWGGLLLNDQLLGRSLKFKAAATLLLGTWIAGAIAEQALNVVRGKDPADMTTLSFWRRSLVRGGGLGLVGDLLLSEQTGRSGFFEDLFKGPVFNLADKGGRAVGSGFKALFDDDPKAEAQFANNAFQFVKGLLPGRTLWYTRLAFERMFLDNLQGMIDPDHQQRFNRIIRRAESERGETFFSPPGEGFPPERGPDLERAFGS